MNKSISLFLLLLMIGAAAMYALDIDPYVGCDFGVSAYQSWIMPNTGISVEFLDWLGAGTEVQALFGGTYRDSWLNAYMFGRLWVFTLGAGASIRLSEASIPEGSEFDTIASPSDKVNFALMTGLDIPLFKTGPLGWGLVTSVDFVFTDTPIALIEDEDLNFFELLIANIASAIVQGSLGSSLNALKFSAGVKLSL